MNQPNRTKRFVFLASGILGVSLVFVFQDFSFLASYFNDPVNEFIARKIIRVLLNDGFMLMVIYSLFPDSSAFRMALMIQLVDGLLLLPLYLVLKLSTEGYSEISAPLLSQLHRLIVNPILLVLLIPALYFQRIK